MISDSLLLRAQPRLTRCSGGETAGIGVLVTLEPRLITARLGRGANQYPKPRNVARIAFALAT